MNSIKIITNFLEKRYGKQIEEHPTRYNITPFEVLLWAFLSHRTRDENTEKVFFKLTKVAKTPEKILMLPDKKLRELIKSSGFYKNKSRNLKILCKQLIEEFKGKVPNNREDLMKLQGVGFKTADIVLSEVYDVKTIPVDTHVHRISKRLGIAELDDNVEDVRKKLEDLIPENKRHLINLGMIKFGREICKPINPLCIKDKNSCPFSNFCKAYRTKRFDVNR